MATEWRARVAAVRTERPWGVWGAAAAAGVISLGVYWHWLNAVPDVRIPAPAPLPSPNGYDDLVRATREFVDSKDVDDAGSGGTAGSPPRGAAAAAYTPADRARLVAENRPALADVRLALSHPFEDPPVRDFEHGDSFSRLALFRRAARLLNLEGHSREDRGDWAGAVSSRLDSMEMGADDVGRGGPLIHYLVGVACEAIGRRPLWRLADRVGAADARAAALRLERIDARRVPAADALTQEKWGGEATLLNQFRRESLFGLFRDLTKAPDTDSSPSAPPAALVYPPLLWTSKAAVLRNYDAAMDRTIADCAQGMGGGPAPVTTLPANTDPITRILFPVFAAVRMKEADSRMQTRLLTAVYALRAYRLERGGYPASLNDLVTGGYLTRVPDDPFGPPGAPIRYRRLAADKYLLYSVGPDGKDDGGKPIDAWADWHRRRKTWAEAGMVGDWVVGVDNYSR